MAISKNHVDIDITLKNWNKSHTEFVYLGSQISEDGKCDQDVKRRSSLTSAIVGKLGDPATYQLRLLTKIKVYESLVISVFLRIRMLEPAEKRRKQDPVDRNGLAQKNTGSLQAAESEK